MPASAHAPASFPSANIPLAKACHVAQLRIMVEKDRQPFVGRDSKANRAKGIDVGRSEKLGPFMQSAIEGWIKFH